MPKNGSLCPDDTRNFIRRLRDKIGKNFKYFLCGEYGEQNNRPHYHAIIFGYDFGLTQHNLVSTSESSPFQGKAIPKSSSGLLSPIEKTSALRSPILDQLWQLGHTSVGELTFESACYVAQYSMKKVTGSRAKSHYNGRHPEFMRFSKNAIGKQYAEKYASEIINSNSVMANSIEQPIPNYYLKLYEKQNLDLTLLKQSREEFSQTHTIEKSYIRAQKLDSKFKFKISKSDQFRVRYATDQYFADWNPTSLKGEKK